VVQLIVYSLPKLVEWILSPLWSYRRPNVPCGLFSLVLGITGWVHGNGSRHRLATLKNECKKGSITKLYWRESLFETCHSFI